MKLKKPKHQANLLDMTTAPKPVLEESSEYDNYLDVDKRKGDGYSSSLDKFFDAPVESKLYDQTKTKKDNENLYKVIYVHFRDVDSFANFCSTIGQIIHYKSKSAYYPASGLSASLFPDDEPKNIEIDKNLLAPKMRKSSKSATLDVEVSDDVDINAKWSEHWKDMPEYIQEDNPPFHTIHMKFSTEEHYQQFAKRIGQDLNESTKSTWYPKLEITANRKLRWMDDAYTVPEHPMYIVSKGRHESMHTSRSLGRMRIPHYIIIEPQDESNYETALDTFGIRDYVTLIVAPFSNHGDGPGRARNFAWDHSISIGATSHWVFDDNISDFYRLHQNKRIRFESGAGFKAMEDFVSRYENVYIAGPQYRFFIAPDQKYPPYVANTRIYSSLLIRNDCPHRWRGRYNEDTDICLRVLKDGHCTIQFNAFMQGKAATQTVKGGNTEEFYHTEMVENDDDIKLGKYHEKGTVNKSQMLVDMHPDVTRMVFRYGRWHHWVDYSSFKKNALHLAPGTVINKSSNNVNNYGMYLIDDYDN